MCVYVCIYTYKHRVVDAYRFLLHIHSRHSNVGAIVAALWPYQNTPSKLLFCGRQQQEPHITAQVLP